MSSSSSSSTGGIVFVGLLNIVLIILKLTGFIVWSWWWVLSPFWISASITIAIIGIVLVLSLIGALFASRR